jgi:hypothetical protein
VGSMLVSWIAEHFGAAASIWSGGAVSLLAAFGVLAWQLRLAGEKLSFQVRPLPRLSVINSDRVPADVGAI